MKHFFEVSVAIEYGLPAAILLENIAYWTAANEANGLNFYDGRYWTYNSRRAFRELFPYIGEKQIYNGLQKLIEAGFLVTGVYNKLPFDRTLWYALTEKGKSIVHYDTMSSFQTHNDIVSKGTDNTRYKPDINTLVNTDINTGVNKRGKKAKAADSVRHKCGAYGWVQLSNEERDRLKQDLGVEELMRCITYVDEAAQATGNKNKWKDWNLVIRKCSREGWGLGRSKQNRPNDFETGNPFLEMLEERRGTM